jgi:hypothetical protein
VVDSDAGKEAESRPPTLEDLLHLCSELNRAGAKYIVIGGMAIIRLGSSGPPRTLTFWLILLLRTRSLSGRPLMTLPDQAVREMTMTDLDDYRVIRVADEIVVDLMKSACGIAYPEASQSIEWEKIEGVPIHLSCSPYRSIRERAVVMEAETSAAGQG